MNWVIRLLVVLGLLGPHRNPSRDSEKTANKLRLSLKTNSLKSNLVSAAILLVAALIPHISGADVPARSPATSRAISDDGRIRVISTPRGNTAAYSIDGRRLWTVPGWHQTFLVSNNGTDLITVYSGQNLIPKNYSNDLILLTVWRKGKKYREFRLREIVTDPSMLAETSSHYFWGALVGLRDGKKLVINRSDGRQIFLNYENGIIEVNDTWLPSNTDGD